MKKIDNSMIEVDGRFYMYDYDSDCYFRIREPRTLTLRERMENIAIAVCLLAVIIIGSKYYF